MAVLAPPRDHRPGPAVARIEPDFLGLCEHERPVDLPDGHAELLVAGDRYGVRVDRAVRQEVREPERSTGGAYGTGAWVGDHPEMTPCPQGTDAACPQYASKHAYRYALEQPAGSSSSGALAACAS